MRVRVRFIRPLKSLNRCVSLVFCGKGIMSLQCVVRVEPGTVQLRGPQLIYNTSGLSADASQHLMTALMALTAAREGPLRGPKSASNGGVQQ